MKKKTIFISGILIVTLVAGGIYYLRFRSSPQYSLLLLGNAVMQHDYAGFEKYVDVDGTLSSLIDQSFERDEAGSNPALNFLSGTGIMDMIKPQLGQLFKPLLRQWVEQGKSSVADPLAGEGHFALPDIWSRSVAYRIDGVEFTKRDGVTAMVGLGIRPVDTDTLLVLTVQMINKGDHWQISKLPGFSNFRKAVTNIEQRRIEAINKVVEEQMQQTLKIEYLLKDTTKEKILIGIKNTGTKIIASYEAVVSRDMQDNEFIHLNRQKKNFDPGKTDSVVWTTIATEVQNHFLPATLAPWDNAHLSVQFIQFSDSTFLRRKSLWQWD